MLKKFLFSVLCLLPMLANAQVFNQNQIVVPPFLNGGIPYATSSAGNAKLTIISTSTLLGLLNLSTTTTYTGTYPIVVSGSVISTGFSTSTINVFSAQNTFNNASATALTATRFYFTNASGTGITATDLYGTHIGAVRGTTGSFSGVLNASSTLGVTGRTDLYGQTSFANASGTSLGLTGSLYDAFGLVGSSGQVLSSTGTSTKWITPNAGTVTAVSVASANGFAGSSSGGATPALTLSTTVTGILVGNGTSIAATTTTGTGHVALSNSPTFTGNALFSNITNSGLFVTLNGSSTNTSLGGYLYDSTGRPGTLGQLLWSTGTSSLWVSTSSLGISGTSYTGTYPIQVNGSVISSGFSTSTINVFSAKQTFANASATSMTATDLYATNSSLGQATGTNITATTAFLPDANGGADLGSTFNGFSSLFLKDSASAGTVGLQITNTGAAASQTLTFDVGNYSPTLIFSGGAGNPTLGNWFDQNVKTTGSPIFAGVKSTTFLNASTTLGVTGGTDLYSTLNVTGATTLASTLGITGKTTFANASGTSLTSTTIYGTNIYASGLSNTYLWADSTGKIVASTTPGGTIYTGTYPIQVNGSVISSGFSTSTINVFSAKQTFANASATSLTADTLYWTSATGTNLFSTTGSHTNGTSTNWGVTNLSATNAVTTNSTTTISNIISSMLLNGTQIMDSSRNLVNVNTYTGGTINGQTISNSASFTGTLSATGGLVALATTTINGDLTMNGKIIPRVVGYTSSATLTVNLDTTDIATTTINQTTAIANPTGSVVNGQMFEIIAMATGTRTLTWGTSYASSTDLAQAYTVASGTTRFLFEYRGFGSVGAKWDLVGKLGVYP